MAGIVISNTNGTDSEIIYTDAGAQTLANTGFTFTAGTSPSGAENHQYVWEKTGKKVDMWFYITYVTAGATVTNLIFPLPSDMPAPLELAGTGAASEQLYFGTGYLGVSKTTVPAVISRVTLMVNSGDTGWQIEVAGSSVSARVFYGHISYRSAS